MTEQKQSTYTTMDEEWGWRCGDCGTYEREDRSGKVYTRKMYPHPTGHGFWGECKYICESCLERHRLQELIHKMAAERNEAAEEHCKTCAYWVPYRIEPSQVPPYEESVGSTLGYCKRRAPKITDGGLRFPTTVGNDWCGDGSAYDKTPEQKEAQYDRAMKTRDGWKAAKREREKDLVDALGPWYDK